MRAILIAAIAGLASMAAQAQVKESITIRQGQLTVLQLSEAFTEVLVGDTSVLDALPKGNQAIVLQAKQPGLTDVLLFGSSGAQRQITVTVRPIQSNVAGVGGLVLTHNKPKGLPLYTAYVCDPICRRVSDPFQCADCADTTSQLTTRSTSTITNVTQPP